MKEIESTMFECPKCNNQDAADLIIIEDGLRIKCDKCGLVFDGDDIFFESCFSQLDEHPTERQWPNTPAH